MEKLNYEWVKGLGSFCGVKLRGNETFDELLEIEKKAKGKFNLIQKKFPPFDKGTNGFLYVIP